MPKKKILNLMGRSKNFYFVKNFVFLARLLCKSILCYFFSRFIAWRKQNFSFCRSCLLKHQPEICGIYKHASYSMSWNFEEFTCLFSHQNFHDFMGRKAWIMEKYDALGMHRYFSNLSHLSTEQTVLVSNSGVSFKINSAL